MIKVNEHEGRAPQLIVEDVRALKLQKTEAGSTKPGRELEARAFKPA